MKFARILVLFVAIAAISFAVINAEAGWNSIKKKVEKASGKEDKKKKKDLKDTDNVKIYSENFGTGVRKTGGTLSWLEMTKLQDSDDLVFKCVSGKCNSVTVHGRTSKGIWGTLYQGQLKEVNVGTAVAGKRNSYTHLIISVNGAHESYDKTPAKMEIKIVAGKTAASSKIENSGKNEKEEKTDKSGKLIAENFGTGIPQKGGTVVKINVSDLKDDDILSFKCIEGECKSINIQGITKVQGRLSNLSSIGWGWDESPIRQSSVKDIFGSNSRASYTHLVITVNGKQDSFLKTAAKLEVSNIGPKKSSNNNSKDDYRWADGK